MRALPLIAALAVAGCGGRSAISGPARNTCPEGPSTAAVDCDECVPLSGEVVACRNDLGIVNGDLPSLAATDTAVAMAWSDSEVGATRTLDFALLSPDLKMFDAFDVGGTAVTPVFHRRIMGTAVAPLASGWVVAVAGEPEVFAHAIDAAGRDLGRITLDTVEEDAIDYVADAITLVPRPNGGPLAIWRAVHSLRAAVLSADGRSATAPVDLTVDDRGSTSGPSGAFVGGAFYVVYAASAPVPADQSLRLVRVDVDGHATKVADLLPGEPTEHPFLAAGANDLRLSYVGAGPAGADRLVLWRRLGLDGAPLAGPVTVGAPPEYEGSGPVVAAGDDTIVLVAGRDHLSLGVARVSLNGVITKPVQPIARSPVGLKAYRLVRRGPDAVASWHAASSTGGRIGTARLKL